ncbi:MAG TPA: hypothetical protein VFN67_31345 [Polyangiales bacterium]|nr:hypothetical protein [Polyangiales bacterium]
MTPISMNPGTVGGAAGMATVPPATGAAGKPGPAVGTAGSGTTPSRAGTGTSGTTATAGAAATGGSTATAGTAAAAGTTATAGTGGAMASGGAGAPSGGMMMGKGACCSDGDCLCHGDPPSAPTSEKGPFKTDSYDIASAGCVFYPTDAEPPFAAVAISDGFGGSGGCGPSQTGQWGELYASWGIVAMIIHTTAGDQPEQRGTKLTAAIAAYKMENEKSGSALMGKLSGRYGTSGFSMGGGGTTFASANDPTLKSSVAIMAWTPTREAIKVPSLFIFGSSDTLAGTMGMSGYTAVEDGTPKMTVTVNSGHAGQPTSGGGASGKAGLAFQKVYLEGDERWLPVLKMIDADDSSNID